MDIRDTKQDATMYRKSLLVVDDMEINRAILAEIFSQDFSVLEAENGKVALDLLEKHGDDIAIVLLDVVMPVMDGYGVLEGMRTRKMLGHVPVIIITSLDSHKDEARLFDLGASDLIMKPFNPLAIRKRVMNVTEQYRYRNHLEQLVEEQASRLERSNQAMIDTLGAIIEYRSMETGQHIARIRGFTRLILTEIAQEYPEYGLNEKEISLISSASAMHDIGKIVIPDAVLNKPGRLTPEEFEIIKTHTTAGAEILERFDRVHREEYFTYATVICRHHHERWDGNGYPDRLEGDEIPISAQAVGIADCYDALTTPRVYKPAFPHDTAMRMIISGQCGIFSDKLLNAFTNAGPAFERLAKAYNDGEILVKLEG
ncbi:response regulator [Eubacteriales bacterium OttesenSCG-928-A19]|nr:response regulator [Eubacteriales bacterium OttesenSCG-928-A19]